MCNLLHSQSQLKDFVTGWRQAGAKVGQDGAKVRQEETRIGLDRAKIIRVGIKIGQDGAKMAEARKAKMKRRWSQDAQDGAKMDPNGAIMAQDASRWSQDGPTWCQDEPKSQILDLRLAVGSCSFPHGFRLPELNARNPTGPCLAA